MTPGSYIRTRREAAGLSVAAVMAVLAGGGLLSAPLEDIEADRAEPTGLDAALLSYAFAIDDFIVARIKDGEPVQICERCGCSEGYECQSGDWGRCSLAARTTCSTCAMEAQVGLRAVA